MDEGLLGLMRARRGHFQLESGHHGNLWLELDTLFDRPAHLTRFVDSLGRRLAESCPELACGPLTGGAFVALRIAEVLDIGFCYTERIAEPVSDALYSARYALLGAPDVAGRRVAVVDDVINAGSATSSTLETLRAAGAEPVAIGALLVLGDNARQFAENQKLALAAVADYDNTIWEPGHCPLCAAGVSLDS